MLRRSLHVGLAALLTFTGMTAIADNADASYSCSGRPPEHILKYFHPHPPWVAMPRRCGGSYGSLHIKSRYDSDPLFDFNIEATVENPQKEVLQGTSVVFYSLYQGCAPKPYFKVVFALQKYSDGKAKGLITAYNIWSIPQRVSTHSAVKRATACRP